MGLYDKDIQEGLGLVEKEKNCYYGEYKGYEVTLYNSQQGFDLFLNFYGSKEQKLAVAQVFQNAGNKTLVKTEVSTFGFHSVINGMTIKTIIKKIVEKLDITVAYLKENDIKGVGYCMNCGNIGILTTVKVNDVYVTLDNECLDKIEKMIKKSDEEFIEQPNNYVRGILGALLGAVIGAVTWIVIYLLGYLSAISAILSVFLANYFYVKFGGKANNVKTIIVSTISLVVLILTCFLIYLFLFEDLEIIFMDDEIKSAFIYDMLMNVVFTAIGVVAQYASTKKKDQANRMKISK